MRRATKNRQSPLSNSSTRDSEETSTRRKRRSLCTSVGKAAKVKASISRREVEGGDEPLQHRLSVQWLITGKGVNGENGEYLTPEEMAEADAIGQLFAASRSAAAAAPSTDEVTGQAGSTQEEEKEDDNAVCPLAVGCAENEAAAARKLLGLGDEVTPLTQGVPSATMMEQEQQQPVIG